MKEMDRMNDDDMNKLTYRTIGCTLEVRNHPGNGFQGVACQRVVRIEMNL